MALSFGSSAMHSNALRYGNITALNAFTAYTMALWIYVTTAPSASTTDYIAAKWSGTDGWLLGLFRDSTGTGTRLSTTHYQSSAAATGLGIANEIVTGSWNHVAVTWSGTQALFYLNGALTATRALTQAIGTNSSNFVIGNLTSENNGAAAILQDFMIWTTALTADEIRAVRVGGIPQGDALVIHNGCMAAPGYDYVSGTVPTKVGTVTTNEWRKKGSRMKQGYGQPMFYEYLWATSKRSRSPIRMSEQWDTSIEESVAEDLVTSETVTRTEPDSLSTTWVKDRGQVTQHWAKGEG
jgi:hypothetical protein